MEGHAVFNSDHAVNEMISGRATVFVLLPVIVEVITTKPAFRLGVRRRRPRHDGLNAFLRALEQFFTVVVAAIGNR